MESIRGGAGGEMRAGWCAPCSALSSSLYALTVRVQRRRPPKGPLFAMYVHCNANYSGGDHLDNLWAKFGNVQTSTGAKLSTMVCGLVSYSLLVPVSRALPLLPICYKVNSSATMCHAGNSRFPTGYLIFTFLFAITNTEGLPCARYVLRGIFVRDVQN